jgi:uncharacterized membrane protein
MKGSLNAPEDDSIIDGRISILLRSGTYLSAAVIAVGGALLLLRDASARTDFRQFHGQPHYLTSLPGIASYAIHANPRAVIQSGLLLLIATPIARVLFAVIAFAIQRDKLYVFISLIVLLALLYGLIWH